MVTRYYILDIFNGGLRGFSRTREAAEKRLEARERAFRRACPGASFMEQIFEIDGPAVVCGIGYPYRVVPKNEVNDWD